ncbi:MULTISPECIES: hypothetical protein [Shewanella]|uniref:Site-specific integrase n=1 Tax=Shewanella marisflavi TaxID=260364 RepID=A0ABX5WL77_9GAMM|nr:MULTISPECIES: hypothetical protein [Shewanella]QDF75255.1 hypothetical protein FGA12_08850 [Shewanella marisflavi]
MDASSFPSETNIANLIQSNDEVITGKVRNFLENIECPPDFRGLRVVATFLERLVAVYPAFFMQVMQFDVGHLKGLGVVDTQQWPLIDTKPVAKGWMSQRPVYSLLLTFANIDFAETSRPILLFLRHYFEHEIVIATHEREESAFRAFRLALKTQEFDLDCVSSDEAQQNTMQLAALLDELQSAEESQRNLTLEGYVRELKHFYSLDWRAKQHRRLRRKKSYRASYRGRKFEYITGSDSLYVLQTLPDKLDESQIENGLESLEDVPPCAVVMVEPEAKSRPKHEMPDIAQIKDQDKLKARQRSISQNTGRAHNINAMHRTVLQPHELAVLWQELTLTKRKPINGLAPKYVQQALLLSLLTTRTLDELKAFHVIESEESDGVGVFEHDGMWYWKNEVKPTANRGKHSASPHLKKTNVYAVIQLPFELASALGLGERHVGDCIVQQVAKLKKAAKQFFHSLNNKHQVQINQARVERFLVNLNQATGCIDPVCMEVLRGAGYYTRSSRHYAWNSNVDLNFAIGELWKAMFAYMGQYASERKVLLTYLPYDVDKSIGIGSQFTPTSDSVRKFVAELLIPLTDLSPHDVSISIKSAIDYHNHYTLYTLYMLLNATGYRAVHNPLPSFSLHLKRFGLLGISDKDASKNLAHSRVVVVPEMLTKQLECYQRHCEVLGSLLTGSYPSESKSMLGQSNYHLLSHIEGSAERLDWLNSVKHSTNNDGNFLLFDTKENGKFKSVNAGPCEMEMRHASSVSLPYNFGRHYVRHYLQSQHVPQEWVQVHLGHFNYGELALGRYSSLDHLELATSLAPILDTMLDELGWVIMPSILTRGRK